MNGQDTKSGSMMQNAMISGLIMGIILTALSVIFYVLDYQGNLATVANVIVMAAVIVYFVIQYRDKKADGFISYGQSVGFGTLMSVAAAIVSAIYTYLLVKVIDPGYLSRQMEKELQKLIEEGKVAEEQIDMVQKTMEVFAAPLWTIISVIIGTIIIGVIISLLASIFLKRENLQSQGF